MAEPNLFKTDKIDEHMNAAKNSDDNSENNILKNITATSKRLKIIEDRYVTIRKKTQITDQNMLEINHKFNEEIKSINEELNKLKLLMKDMAEKIDQMITEMNGLAKHQDLLTLSKYVDFWKQFNFLTREQLERELKPIRDKL